MENERKFNMNLNDIPEQVRQHMKEDKVSFSKFSSKIDSKSRIKSKLDYCYYCKKENPKFCNSHSVPAFILRNLTISGELYWGNKLMNLPLGNSKKGIRNAGTFQIICTDCDSKIFSDYENFENYKSKPSQIMLAQIAMKNFLKDISKRSFEIERNKTIIEDHGNNPFLGNKEFELDLNEDKNGFYRAKKALGKDWKNEYYMFFYEKLDYVVPVAFQNKITIICDFKDETVNNIYNNSPKYRMQQLHICIFPFESHSVIILFLDSNDNRYRKFRKQFLQLSLEDKLFAINFIVLAYSEDYFISKKIDKSVFDNKNIQKIAGETPIINSYGINPIEKIKNVYSFKRMKTIPNLLLRRYCIK